MWFESITCLHNLIEEDIDVNFCLNQIESTNSYQTIDVLITNNFTQDFPSLIPHLIHIFIL